MTKFIKKHDQIIDELYNRPSTIDLNNLISQLTDRIIILEKKCINMEIEENNEEQIDQPNEQVNNDESLKKSQLSKKDKSFVK